MPRLSLRLDSLRVQLAVGSALVALVAVLIVSLSALASVDLSFRSYQRTQLATEAAHIAFALGGQRGVLISLEQAHTNAGVGEVLGPLVGRQAGGTSLWIMDPSGRVLVTSGPLITRRERTTLARDEVPVLDALHDALQGQSSEGDLPSAGFMPFTARLYAAAPVHIGGSSNGTIIGAVALSAPPRVDRAAVFATSVSQQILLVALGVALLAALAAALFAQRLVRPLARLTAATTRMVAGDYATRVNVRTPDELHALALTFNEMAAALQRDVGELHRQELLRRELLANVSHELATPLTAIQGFTEALLDGVVREPADRAETTRLIAREAARLRRLVDQLRQVALYEAGDQALDRAPLHLPTLVEETLAVLAPELERKQVAASSELPPNLPPVFADADRLAEILLNLLDNALRHTPAGGRIEVTGAVEGRYVRVSVADTGPGIAPEDRHRIFERFYRVDASRNSTTGGSGLGLTIVRALVEAHGGTVRADERPGGGARVAFTLPVAGHH
jgi:signal transduction histidine kinase